MASAQDPSWELQTAIVGRLKADVALARLTGGKARIYDYVPEREEFPYIVYENPNTAEWDTSSEYGSAQVLQINVWSRREGAKEARLILRRVQNLLHDQEAGLTLNGHKLVNLRMTFQQMVKEPDGQHYHGVLRFRAITEEV
jgi:hypothetical protein